jgi:hypothetical protein
VLFTVKAFLGEYYSNNSIKGVYFEEIVTIKVVVGEEGGFSKYTIECFKHLNVLIYNDLRRTGISIRREGFKGVFNY